MLFHSWIFILFFLIVYPVYLLLKQTRFRLHWLLLVSYVFYGWWDPLYLLLILFSTTVDYLVVVAMSRRGRKKRWLSISVINNLALLGFFKYGALVADSLNALLARSGAAYVIPAPGLLLPIGISFYVFQSMSYTIDYYRGNVEKEPDFICYAAFVSLFPRLLAGPIERARNLLPQLHRTPRISGTDIAEGLSLFVVGLFKKVALADYLALYVDKVYGTPGQFDSPALILAGVAFAWQIYFDFSGYTDMARGIGRLMGIRIMLNFNNPYMATGLGDFWRRWHISLSTWFRDYLYIPLGGNRRGAFNTYRNIFLTMLISGLWHGAAWTFVIWGAVHGLGRLLTRHLETTAFYEKQVPVFVKRLWVFVFVTFAWIFFRAESLGDARLIVTRIFAFRWGHPAFPLVALLLISSVWLYQFVYESRFRRMLTPAPVRVVIVVAMILYMLLFVSTGSQPFIYLQF